MWQVVPFYIRMAIKLPEIKHSH